MFASACTSVSSRLSVNSSNHSGSSRNVAKGCPRLDCYPSFYFCFGFFGESRQIPGAGSSLRSDAVAM